MRHSWFVWRFLSFLFDSIILSYSWTRKTERHTTTTAIQRYRNDKIKKKSSPTTLLETGEEDSRAAILDLSSPTRSQRRPACNLSALQNTNFVYATHRGGESSLFKLPLPLPLFAHHLPHAPGSRVFLFLELLLLLPAHVRAKRPPLHLSTPTSTLHYPPLYILTYHLDLFLLLFPLPSPHSWTLNL